MAPFIQKLYDLFVLLYLLFALDRLLHIVGLLRRRTSVVEKKKVCFCFSCCYVGKIELKHIGAG